MDAICTPAQSKCNQDCSPVSRVLKLPNLPGKLRIPLYEILCIPCCKIILVKPRRDRDPQQCKIATSFQSCSLPGVLRNADLRLFSAFEVIPGIDNLSFAILVEL